MIEIDVDGQLDLFLRTPSDKPGTQSSGCVSGSTDLATYTLENQHSQFVFAQDEIGGFRLVQFSRKAEDDNLKTWTNVEENLWRLIITDTNQRDALATSTLLPTAALMDAPSATPTEIVLRWPSVSVGGTDVLDVRVSLELRAGEDFLRASCTVSWVGTAVQYAVDSVCLLPVRVAPKNRGNDFAVMPITFGMTSKDPVTNLRWDPQNGRTAATFAALLHNNWFYPSGRGWNMCFWGYYETLSNEAWMIWNERWDKSLLACTFQSDGENILNEMYFPAEDNIQPGNNNRSLEVVSTCLMPLGTTAEHGWWDIASQYKQRLEAVNPPWLVERRNERPGNSDLEKRPYLFIDVSHVGYTGTTAPILALINSARAAVGVGTETPVFGTIEATFDNFRTMWEDEVGDLRQTLPLLFDQNIFLGKWTPFNVGPELMSKYRWANDVLNVWQDQDFVGSMIMSRRGRIEVADVACGGENDSLCEKRNKSFYHERTYNVTGWDSLTNTIFVDDDPSLEAQFFIQALIATLKPAANARLAQVTVASISANAVHCSSIPTDGTGTNVIPVPGDQLVVSSSDIETTAFFCPHAVIHAQSFLTELSLNYAEGRFRVARNCHTYFDVFSEPNHFQPLVYNMSCYRDHGTWSRIDASYQQHPLGGGSWYTEAMTQFIESSRDLVRAAQQSVANKVAHMFSCEDIDETMMRGMDFCWHTLSSGELWRNGVQPSDGFKAVPLFAVVHAGRTFGRALNHEFSSATIKPAYRADSLLHRTLAYEMCVEWPYGLTATTLSLYADDVDGAELNLFDDANYFSGGGTVNDEVKQIRDLWVQMAIAETRWATPYLRYGDLLSPPVLSPTGTSFTTSLANTLYTGFRYYSYDVIYDHNSTPRIISAFHRDRFTGAVAGFFVNWTEVTGDWSGTIDVDSYGLLVGNGVNVSVLDYYGNPTTAVDVDFDLTTGQITVTDLPAYSTVFIKFTPIPVPNSVAIPARYDIAFDVMATELEPLTIFAGDSMFLRYQISDMRSDASGSTLLDLTGVSAKWSLTKSMPFSNYASTPSVDKKTPDVSVSISEISSAIVATNGSGYSVGDILSITGGSGLGGLIRVAATNSFGGVTLVSIFSPGSYIQRPSTVAGCRGGTGVGAILKLGFRIAPGIVLVRLRSADTRALRGDYHAELELFDQSNKSDVVAVGDVTVAVNIE